MLVDLSSNLVRCGVILPYDQKLVKKYDICEKCCTGVVKFAQRVHLFD